MITDVLFDLDDTLRDFSGAKRRGLAAALALLPERARAQAESRWAADEPSMYREFAAGRSSRDEYRFQRFATLAADEPGDRLQSLVAEMNRSFMFEVNDRIELMPGAVDCLHELRSMSIRCHLLTNGPTDGQRRKIERLGLAPLLDYIQIGEEAGVFKPDPAAFELALRSIDRPADRVLMVGDSLTDDIEAAEAAGLSALHLSVGAGHADITELAGFANAIRQVR